MSRRCADAVSAKVQRGISPERQPSGAFEYDQQPLWCGSIVVYALTWNGRLVSLMVLQYGNLQRPACSTTVARHDKKPNIEISCLNLGKCDLNLGKCDVSTGYTWLLKFSFTQRSDTVQTKEVRNAVESGGDGKRGRRIRLLDLTALHRKPWPAK